MTVTDTLRARRLEVQRLKEIPPLPMAAQNIVSILGDPDVEMKKVVSAVEQDPALAARVVGMANSAFFGVNGGVKTVEQAIIRALGLDLVKALALSVCMNNVFDASSCRHFNALAFWHRATRTAVLASLLASSVNAAHGTLSRQHVYLCGLIHNLGILALVHCYPEAMSRAFEMHMLSLADGLPTRLAALEEDLVGADHYMAGGWLARKWGLPEDVVHVIEHHAVKHYRNIDWPLVQLVGHAARWISRIDSDGAVQPDLELVELLGVPAERLERAQLRLADRDAELESLARTLSS